MHGVRHVLWGIREHEYDKLMPAACLRHENSRWRQRASLEFGWSVHVGSRLHHLLGTFGWHTSCHKFRF